MGLYSTKPEFVSVSGDKQVKAGDDVVLACEANTYVTAVWEKNGVKLQCVGGKHKVTQTGTKHTLEIKNAEYGDKGEYKITLTNDAGSDSYSAKVIVECSPEFVYVLGDKQVKQGDEFVLSCEANIAEVTATWEKCTHNLEQNDHNQEQNDHNQEQNDHNREQKGHKLKCVEGKHKVTETGGKHTLKINNADKGDEGKYTITLKNDSGSASCSAIVTVELREWRKDQWKQDPIIETLKNVKLMNDGVRELRFLLHGPVGAGKSSIINTIKSIFEGYQYINCLTASDASEKSFTLKYQKFTFKVEQSGHLPFAFYDVRGLEERESHGVCTDDIIKALKGHIPDDYELYPEASMSEDNSNYISNPTLNNKIHCLVSVIAADRISLMDENVIKKLKLIRAEASKLGMPQVLFMTRVDKACKLTKQDVGNIYKSKKVKDKMQECSNRLGITMNCIFPVMNYHEETKPNEKLNCLMLEAMKQIVFSARDYVQKCSDKQKPATGV